MNKRGSIVSSKFENVNLIDNFKYYRGKHELETTIKIEDGVINFDERKTHIRNLENFMKRYYAVGEEATFQKLGKLKERINGFDGK